MYVQNDVYSNCGSSFDPRLSSWFVLAASGPKSVVIVADASAGAVSLADFYYTQQGAIVLCYHYYLTFILSRTHLLQR